MSEVKRGQPTSAQAAASLERWSRTIRVPLVLSAILPLLISPEKGGPVAIVIGVVSWLVFLADLIVNVRLRRKYIGTGFGTFDLIVVILTAPWFLLPGFSAGRFVVVLRLARLVRLLLVSRGAKRLTERLGRVGLFAVSVLVVCSFVTWEAEKTVNASEYKTFGDALWWGVVTLTTVGYGNQVPITSVGKWMAVIIMFTGVAVLGLLAGSLASFFRLEPKPSAEPDSLADAGTEEPEEPAGASLDEIKEELAALRAHVMRLTEMLDVAEDS